MSLIARIACLLIFSANAYCQEIPGYKKLLCHGTVDEYFPLTGKSSKKVVDDAVILINFETYAFRAFGFKSGLKPRDDNEFVANGNILAYSRTETFETYSRSEEITIDRTTGILLVGFDYEYPSNRRNNMIINGKFKCRLAEERLF